jgi:hypothetical protein
MPFTPFHFGPGAAVKAVAPRYFSFTVFCFAQIVTDLETAYYMLRGEYPLHRWLHTYLGATIVAVLCSLIGRPICKVALRSTDRIDGSERADKSRTHSGVSALTRSS